MAETKPFCISKRAVWQAWLRVKANRGAAGVDEESIAKFEKRLKRNLYKIWNRMSSGTYFPPPVRTVKILASLSGHRTIDMTLRYAEVTGLDIQRAYTNTMAAIETHYEMPQFPAVHRASNRKSARRAVLTHIETLAAELEAFRRDYAKQSERKRVQRFVERLRRLAMDFKTLKG